MWLFDIANLKYSTIPPLVIIKEISHILQYYYPERLYRVFVLFSPWIFRMVWKMVQSLITENTKGKIIFPGWYESEQYSTFSNYIEKDKLLMRFGGTLDMEYSYEWELQTSLENNHYFYAVENNNNNNNVVEEKEDVSVEPIAEDVIVEEIAEEVVDEQIAEEEYVVVEEEVKDGQ